jgi:RNA polymerase sigma-70 factor, ECF subfamily
LNTDLVIEENQENDLALIAAANAGDPKAFEALYFRYRQWVVNLAFRITGDRDLALDIMQETFLYLLRKIPGFQLRCQMRSFLYPVVKNLSLSTLSHQHRYISGEELFLSLEAPAGPVGANELQAVFRTLPAAHREVIILRFLEGMDLQEIAAALDVPLGTVKSRLHHALESLRSNPKAREYFD